MPNRRMPNNVPSNLQQTVRLTIRKKLNDTTYSVYVQGSGAQALAKTSGVTELSNGLSYRATWYPDIRRYVINESESGSILGVSGDIDIWSADAWPLVAGSENDEFADHQSADALVQAVVPAAGGGLSGWSISSEGGFSDPPYAIHADLIEGANVASMAFNPSGTVIVFNSNTSLQLQAFEWIPGVGLGNEYPQYTLQALSRSGNTISWSPDGNYIAVGITATPFIEVVNWNDVTGFGSKVSDPASLPPNDVDGVDFSPDGAYLALATTASPFIIVYPWSAGFGATVADPASLPTAAGDTIRWNHDNSYLALAIGASPWIEVWAFTTVFGSKVANPSTLPGGQPMGLEWDLASTSLTYGETLNDDLFTYAWSAGFGSRVTYNLGTDAADFVHGLRFNHDKTILLVETNFTPYIHAYNFAGGAIGTELATPVHPPTSEGAFRSATTWTPASAGAPDGWTEFDFGSTLTITEEEYGLSLLQATAGAEQIGGLYKTVPAGDFTIWCKTSLLAELAANANAGLVLLEDGTLSTGDMVTLSLGYNATTVTLSVDVWTAYNAFSSTSKSITITLLSDAYLRIRRSGTTYYFDVSTNGIGWIEIYTGTLGFTPAEFGLYVNNDNTGQDIRAAHQFFRYLAYNVGTDGVVNGDRISLFREAR